jgi:hypothetical protein
MEVIFATEVLEEVSASASYYEKEVEDAASEPFGPAAA